MIPSLIVQQNWVYPSQHSSEQSQFVPGTHSHMNAYADPGLSRNSIGETDSAAAVTVAFATKLRLEERATRNSPSVDVMLSVPLLGSLQVSGWSRRCTPEARQPR